MESEFVVLSVDETIGSFEAVETEQIEQFIIRLRAGIDSLVDKMVEELEEVQSLLENGDAESALNKVQAMLKSIEESDDEADD